MFLPELYQNFDWQIEEDMINELRYESSLPSNDTSCQSFSVSPPPPDIETDAFRTSNTTKKLSHNAYERDRRKKLNHLYSSLRSLLPESDQNRKLSIPCTISRILKYIPELQRKVERLNRKKKEILSRVSKEGEVVDLVNPSSTHPIVTVTPLNEREVVIMICAFNNTTTTAATATSRFNLSRVLRVLEGEGLQLLNASTLNTRGDKTFYNIHLEAKENQSLESQKNFYGHLMDIIKDHGKVMSVGNFVYI